jgi:acyl-CoA synthetase (NDP forming)
VEGWADGLAGIARQCDKPILISISGLRKSIAGVDPVLAAAGVPAYDTPGRAAFAAAALADFADKRSRHAHGIVPTRRPCARRALPLDGGRSAVSEYGAKQCLARYDIPVVRELRLGLEEIDRIAQAPLPFPLAVKVDSPDIAHKTEAGAVRLGIRNLAELKEAASAIVQAASAYAPQARITGVLLQEMAQGVEVIAGALNDPYFGPVVVVGAGGTLAEVLADKALRFAPFDEHCALDMIHDTRVARLLAGYRNSERRDLDALAKILSRLSWLVADHRDVIAEIDINPIFVRQEGQGAVAADGWIVLK